VRAATVRAARRRGWVCPIIPTTPRPSSRHSSGKTTQLPKLCLELGRGVRGMIGHTQPRRLAARTVGEADLVADLRAELHPQLLGDARGDRAGEDTLVKLMTDGI